MTDVGERAEPERLDLRAAALTRVVLIAACTVFFIHALNYLYFFVDDEGIPFVFAKHLLQGKGLVYNSFEGRVEGYSDFLHVIISAGWLVITHEFGLPRLAPFFLGKALSFANGLTTVVLVWHALRRDPGVRRDGLLAGLAFLVLAPPLAQWSCSSLEMATVGMLVAVIACNLLDGSPGRDPVTAVAACLLVLYRIDGFVHAFALLVPAWVAADRDRRRDLTRRVLLPLAATITGYHAWRVWYFGDWLTSPLAAKVLFKLHPVHDIVQRLPRVSYGLAFLQIYGVVPAVVGTAVGAVGLRRSRRAWPLVASACVLVTYAAVVGDWMSGFRFFVPVVPVVALLVGIAVSGLRPAWFARGLTVATCAWFGWVAIGAARHFDGLESFDSWWRHPSFDQRLYFSQYLPLYEDLRLVVPPGSVMAINQAGFVPYMLDVDNVDDLGVCSRFVARTPTTDVVFTEVGRYSPLTDKAPLRTANSYVLYHAPEFVVARLDNILSANSGRIPSTILRGHYTQLFADRHAQAVVYTRTASSLAEFRSNPRTFLENVAHPSRLVRAYDGAPIAPGEFLRRLPFLADEAPLDRIFAGHIAYDMTFAANDVPVYELHVNGVSARTDVTMTLTLRNAAGVVVARDERTLADKPPDQISLRWPDGIKVSQLSVEFDSASGGSTRVILHDLRVQGQTPALEAFVRQLAFGP